MTRGISSEWTMKRLRFQAKINPKVTSSLDRDALVSFLPMDAIGNDGTLRLDQTRTASEVLHGYTNFEDGDVSIAKITPCFENGKGAVMQGLTGGVGFGTTELIILRSEKDINPKFLYYITQSEDFRLPAIAAMLGAGGQKRVPDLYVKDFSAAWPEVHLQSAISDYLDIEIARIDLLLIKKRNYSII